MSLTPDEDADLRRLATFERFGFLDLRGIHRFSDLRRRDRRIEIRPVADNVESLSTVRRPGVMTTSGSCWVYPL